MLKIHRAPMVKSSENTKTLSLKSALPVSNMTHCTTGIKVVTKQECSTPGSDGRDSWVS